MKLRVRKIAIISLVLILSLTFACISLADSEPTLTNEEAASALKTAFEIRENMGFKFTWYLYKQGTPEWRDSQKWFKGSENIPKLKDNAGSYAAYPVKEGFEPEGLKKKIRDVFSKDYAEKIIHDDEDFFYYYFWCESENIWYYMYDVSAQLTNDTFEFPTELDFDSVSVVSCENGVATARIRGYRRTIKKNSVIGYDEPAYENRNFVTTFEFRFEEGKWKVSGGDYARMLYSVQDNSITNSVEFSKEIAETCILGTIYDVYYYTTIGFNRLQTEGLGTGSSLVGEPPVKSNSVFKREFEGNIGDVKTWQEYAKNFCSDEIAVKAADFGKHIGDDGKLYFESGRYPFMSVYTTQNIVFFNQNHLSAEKITVVSSDKTQATVKLDFSDLDYSGGKWEEIIIPLTIEFTRQHEGWKISGGDFLEKLDARYKNGQNNGANNPDTSDFCVNQAIAASIVAFASIVLTAIIKKRFEMI